MTSILLLGRHDPPRLCASVVGVAGVSGGVAAQADGDRPVSLAVFLAACVAAGFMVGVLVDRNTGLTVLVVLLVVVALMVADTHDTLLR